MYRNLLLRILRHLWIILACLEFINITQITIIKHLLTLMLLWIAFILIRYREQIRSILLILTRKISKRCIFDIFVNTMLKVFVSLVTFVYKVYLITKILLLFLQTQIILSIIRRNTFQIFAEIRVARARSWIWERGDFYLLLRLEILRINMRSQTCINFAGGIFVDYLVRSYHFCHRIW